MSHILLSLFHLSHLISFLSATFFNTGSHYKSYIQTLFSKVWPKIKPKTNVEIYLQSIYIIERRQLTCLCLSFCQRPTSFYYLQICSNFSSGKLSYKISFCWFIQGFQRWVGTWNKGCISLKYLATAGKV